MPEQKQTHNNCQYLTPALPYKSDLYNTKTNYLFSCTNVRFCDVCEKNNGKLVLLSL